MNRTMNKLSTAIILVLGAGFLLHFFPPDARPGDAGSRSVVHSLEYGGLTRTYRIYLPASYDNTKRYPLVLALHGGGGSGGKMEELTRSGFNALAERERFVVGWRIPTAWTNTGMTAADWNAGAPRGRTSTTWGFSPT